MQKSQIDNKKIAKNTLLLYCRMFVTLLVGLFTSRVILNALGFVDYGVYNVVGGVVTMLTFLNVGMAGASQRFISYELGSGLLDRLKNVFCTSVITHFTIAMIAVVILESIGLWFLNYRLNIPHERLLAANVVFQASLVTFVVSVISVPYNSCIIAHEKMGAFAYISIYESLSKLAIAYIIMISPVDKLILYALLLMFLQLSIRAIYTIYCKKHFEECSFHYSFDVDLFKKMFAFAGWGCIGNMGFSLKDQGSNILLNLFFGTTVNAARGIATQVSGIINGFASNFTMAMNPQITKSYASGDIIGCKKIALAGSKYAMFLLMLISIPFIINSHYVLRLWLGNVPEYTDIFVTIILISSVVYSLSHTISTAILATGNVKWFQTLLAALLLMELPIAYVILCLGAKPYWALVPSIFTSFLSLILRIVILHRLVKEFSVSEYLWGVVSRCLTIFAISFGISYYIHSFFCEGFFTLLITAFSSICIIACIIYLLGLSNGERDIIRRRIFRKSIA